MKKLANLLGLYCVVCTLLTSCGSSITATGFNENNNEGDPEHNHEHSGDEDAAQKKAPANTSKSTPNQIGQSLSKADKKADTQPQRLAASNATAEEKEIIKIGSDSKQVFTDEDGEKYYFKNAKHKKKKKRTYLTDAELKLVQKEVVKEPSILSNVVV